MRGKRYGYARNKRGRRSQRGGPERGNNGNCCCSRDRRGGRGGQLSSGGQARGPGFGQPVHLGLEAFDFLAQLLLVDAALGQLALQGRKLGRQAPDAGCYDGREDESNQ